MPSPDTFMVGSRQDRCNYLPAPARQFMLTRADRETTCPGGKVSLNGIRRLANS